MSFHFYFSAVIVIIIILVCPLILLSQGHPTTQSLHVHLHYENCRSYYFSWKYSFPLSPLSINGSSEGNVGQLNSLLMSYVFYCETSMPECSPLNICKCGTMFTAVILVLVHMRIHSEWKGAIIGDFKCKLLLWLVAENNKGTNLSSLSNDYPTVPRTACMFGCLQISLAVYPKVQRFKEHVGFEWITDAQTCKVSFWDS